MEDRKDFYKDEFNLERAEDALKYVASKCTLKEILWIVRNIAYDQISYYSEDSKGKIFDGSYDETHIEQATSIQRDLSTMCDLFGQVILGHRNFDEGYLESRVPSYMERKMLQMQSKIKELEKRLEDE